MDEGSFTHILKIFIEILDKYGLMSNYNIGI